MRRRRHPCIRPYGVPWDAWDVEQEARLRALAGTMDAGQIAAVLTAEFGTPRTRAAVRCRAKLLDLSLWRDGYSLQDLERIFGVGHRTIRKHWLEPGLLRARKWVRMGPYEGWHVRHADAAAFVRAYPYLVEPARMQAGHPLRSLAEVCLRGKYVTRDELARYLGYRDGNGIIRWLRRGLVPHVRRPKGGAAGAVFVRTADLPAIKERVEQARAESLARKLARVRSLRSYRRDGLERTA